MKIGIDFSAGSQLAGIGRYTRSLVRALIAQSPNDDFILLEPRQSAVPVRMIFRSPNVVRKNLPLSERMLTRIWHRLRLPLYADALMGGLDVFYAPDFVLPPLRRTPGVLTVHDLSYRFSPGIVSGFIAHLPRGCRPAQYRAGRNDPGGFRRHTPRPD